MSEQLEALPATVIIAAGFITYLSACSEDVREATVANWWQQLESLGLKTPIGSLEANFDLKRFLVTEKEQLQWKSQGLPSDQLSVENAAVILQVIPPLFFEIPKTTLSRGKYQAIKRYEWIVAISSRGCDDVQI